MEKGIDKKKGENTLFVIMQNLFFGIFSLRGVCQGKALGMTLSILLNTNLVPRFYRVTVTEM